MSLFLPHEKSQGSSSGRLRKLGDEKVFWGMTHLSQKLGFTGGDRLKENRTKDN